MMKIPAMMFISIWYLANIIPNAPERLPKNEKNKESPIKNPTPLFITSRVFDISGITIPKNTGIKGSTQGLKKEIIPPKNAVIKLTDVENDKDSIKILPQSCIIKSYPHWV